MDYQEILVDVQDYVATVTLNRPQKLNAYTNLMGDELTHAYTTLGKRDDVRVIIMTGAGRSFCSGADVGAVFQAQINEKDKRLRRYKWCTRAQVSGMRSTIVKSRQSPQSMAPQWASVSRSPLCKISAFWRKRRPWALFLPVWG
jgi:enoyl-CoA hydratase/carnithine racemase